MTVQLHFYTTRLSDDDLLRVGQGLGGASNTSLDFAVAVCGQMKAEAERRIRNHDKKLPPIEPRMFEIDVTGWSDVQVADALSAAIQLACWSRDESPAIERLCELLLIYFGIVVSRRLAHRNEDFEAVSRDLRVEIASAAEPPVCFAIAD